MKKILSLLLVIVIVIVSCYEITGSGTNNSHNTFYENYYISGNTDKVFIYDSQIFFHNSTLGLINFDVYNVRPNWTYPINFFDFIEIEDGYITAGNYVYLYEKDINGLPINAERIDNFQTAKSIEMYNNYLFIAEDYDFYVYNLNSGGTPFEVNHFFSDYIETTYLEYPYLYTIGECVNLYDVSLPEQTSQHLLSCNFIDTIKDLKIYEQKLFLLSENKLFVYDVFGNEKYLEYIFPNNFIKQHMEIQNNNIYISDETGTIERYNISWHNNGNAISLTEDGSEFLATDLINFKLYNDKIIIADGLDGISILDTSAFNGENNE